MSTKSIYGALAAVFLFTPGFPGALEAQENQAPAQKNRLVPIQSKVCKSGIVSKKQLFFHLASLAPTISDEVKYSVGDWRKYFTVENYCSTVKNCAPGDQKAIDEINLRFSDFKNALTAGSTKDAYRFENPGVTAKVYFGSANDTVNAIDCTDKYVLPPPPPTAPIDSRSPLRVRGVSDDLWISQNFGAAQASPPFARTSSAMVSYAADESATHTGTTKIQAAIGYEIPVGPTNSFSLIQNVVPFVSTNISLTDTQRSQRVISPTNFVAAGFQYNAYVDGLHQFTVKPQFVEGTTARSQLTSVQAVYAPWTDASDSAPFPPLNTAIPLYIGTDFHLYGAVLFDVRADAGVYENRGDPAFIANNRDFLRVGSRFGYAFTSDASILPTFTLTVSETELYGASGAYRQLSYFDNILSIYLDPKKLFSFTLQYTNGRDENTFAQTQSYKTGFAGHF